MKDTTTIEPKDEKKNDSDVKSALSPSKLVASGAAAATASVVGGQLGVAGTVIGAGLVSVVSAVSLTLYQHSLDKGRERLLRSKTDTRRLQRLEPVGSTTGRTPTSTFPLIERDESSAASDRSDSDATSARDSNATTVLDPRTALIRTQTGRIETPTTVLDRQDLFPGTGGDGDESEPTTDQSEQPQRWWHRLSKKQVFLAVGLAAAAFVLGLGGILAAQAVTGTDLSKGTGTIHTQLSSGGGSASDDGSEKDGETDGSSSDGKDDSSSDTTVKDSGNTEKQQNGEQPATDPSDVPTGPESDSATNPGDDTPSTEPSAPSNPGNEQESGGSDTTEQGGSDSAGRDSSGSGTSGSDSSSGNGGGGSSQRGSSQQGTDGAGSSTAP
ncbi:hypothetical protein LWF01_14925 [Saxibacter everestensis]|uniref:Uncharacterized protein n=1 Tax=Saxibacter everestensis TaxID=2909229 RepID=A0ABY8QSM3_9MICO|nr:hypothetical protein LWF01_14925 [Brevibacteriaceae bacterium ZFBP1038]